MYVTIQQATKLTGKSRATITRNISSGKLSKTDTGIDTAELMRVYGALIDTLDASHDASKNDSVTTHDASLNESIMTRDASLIEALRAQIELLKDQVSQEREHSAHWRNQATMLLTHQPEPSKPQDSRLWLKLFGRR
jgi:hypothetical protein